MKRELGFPDGTESAAKRLRAQDVMNNAWQPNTPQAQLYGAKPGDGIQGQQQLAVQMPSAVPQYAQYMPTGAEYATGAQYQQQYGAYPPEVMRAWGAYMATQYGATGYSNEQLASYGFTGNTGAPAQVAAPSQYSSAPQMQNPYGMSPMQPPQPAPTNPQAPMQPQFQQQVHQMPQMMQMPMMGAQQDAYQQMYATQMQQMAQMPQMPQMPMGPMSMADVATRSVLVHQLPPNCKCSDLVDEIRFGTLEFVRMVPEDRSAYVNYVDSASAAKLLQQAGLGLITVKGFPIHCSPAQSGPLLPHIATAVNSGATRCLYIGGVSADSTEDSLEREFSIYGTVENVRILNRAAKKMDQSKGDGVEEDKIPSAAPPPGSTEPEGEYRIAFVHFVSIDQAIVAKERASQDPRWSRVRINFGKDRAASDTIKGSAAAHRFGDEMATRSVWLGGIHPQTTYEDICSLVHEGAIESVVIHREKANAFVNFVLPECALAFMQRCKATKLVCHETIVKVGWAKSEPIPRDLAEAILKGATRCVYVGHLNPPRPSEWLVEKAQAFGELEMVRALEDKNIAFLNFTSVHSALRCVNQLRELSRTNEEWSGAKINFAKDRCGGSVPQRSQLIPGSVDPQMGMGMGMGGMGMAGMGMGGVPGMAGMGMGGMSGMPMSMNIPGMHMDQRFMRSPIDQSAQLMQMASSAPGNSRPICKYYAQGQCRNGGNCSFSHGQIPTQGGMQFQQQQQQQQQQVHKFKTVLCRYWQESGGKSCRNGEQCSFAHGDEDMRNLAA